MFFIKCQRLACQDGCSQSHRQAGSNSKRSLSPALELEFQTQAWAGLGLLRPLSHACRRRVVSSRVLTGSSL